MKSRWPDWAGARTRGGGDPTGAQGLGRTDYVLLAVVMLVFWCGVLRQIELPGLYMDAVNPDYLGARILNPVLKNPAWTLPTANIPILGGLYHGVQNLYAAVVVFALLGISVVSVRIAQALFGAAIVICVYLLGLRVTGRRLAASTAALLLASDIAFIASFRTQFYIILCAEVWLVASLLGLWRGGRIGYFASGVFFGFSVYGYFVLGFFLPAMALLIHDRQDRQPAAWMAGVVVGLMPYAAGYASLIWALGGPTNALAWLNDSVRSLAPFSSTLDAWASLAGSWERAILALSNAGNELMLFGESLGGIWPRAKSMALAGVSLAALAVCVRRRSLRLTLLPVSYVLVAALFGSRLWAHHFVVLVPLAYLVLAVAAGQLPAGKVSAFVVVAVGGAFLAGNLHQANRFHARLNETGGTKMASNALSQLAEDARRTPETLYVFPDWGFFMPFVLLTENKVPYILDADAMGSARGNAAQIAIAFWNDGDQEKYVGLLTRAGARETSVITYRQRDGRPAFLLARGNFR